EVRDQAGATGMAPFSIFVVPPAYEPPPAQQGCSASGSAGAFPGAVLALAALLRRNRRRSVSNHSA
ncbi:MAG: MYXO-CTERM sorting domain-containing protein, partial [Myxococcales bacterium]